MHNYVRPVRDKTRGCAVLCQIGGIGLAGAYEIMRHFGHNHIHECHRRYCPAVKLAVGCDMFCQLAANHACRADDREFHVGAFSGGAACNARVLS